jgi:hypothetical protein
MANSQIDNMPGWNEWDALLRDLCTKVPKIAAIRAARAMQGVIEKGLKDETLFARIDSPAIKGIAVESIGGSLRKGPNDNAKVARVGYGVGRRTGRGVPAPHASSGVRTAVLRERLTDKFGSRPVYRRYMAGVKTGSKSVMAGQIAGRQTFAKRPKVSPKAIAKSLAGRISRGTGGQRGRSLARLQGSGMSKRNIHWAVFGTKERTVTNWRGTGRSRKVGRMRQYLMGILDRTLRKYGRAAYEAAMDQISKVLMLAYARRAKTATSRASSGYSVSP